MHYLYLDESGDLGYQIGKPGVSRYFIITILEVSDAKTHKVIEKAVARTLKQKIYGKRTLRQKLMEELKGSWTAFAVKQYFYRQVINIPFKLYTVILDKQRFITQLHANKNRIYNFISHLVLKAIPLDQATTSVMLVLDRSKRKPDIREFDSYILAQLQPRIPPHVPFIVDHNYSHENKLLQAVDLFSWGIFRKYEHGDTDWYDVFQKRIVLEEVYPK